MKPTKKEALERRRRIIFNNDGCDTRTFPVDRDPTPENLLAQRTTPLANTHVDTLSYCTNCSGFDQFTHNTRTGSVLGPSPPSQRTRNIAGTLIEQGKDCLQVMVDFGHENGKEVFWSMRMNVTHDAGGRRWLLSSFKKENPQLLLGREGERLPRGKWSAVNYARSEIRELAYKFAEEVCQNYDIDGVEMDFTRHAVFFPSTAKGMPATVEELDAMTELIRRISTMIDEEGERRKRPILLGVRCQDSAPYAKTIGLDLERWMAEGLIDMFIPGGYKVFNPWSYAVSLGHKYGLKVYPSLSESQIGLREDPGFTIDRIKVTTQVAAPKRAAT